MNAGDAGGRRRWRGLLLAMAIAGSAGPGGGAPARAGDDTAATLDPAELDALLAELEADGGLLTAAERAEIAAQLASDLAGGSRGAARGRDPGGLRGHWDAALTGRPDADARWRGALSLRGTGWAARVRGDSRGSARRLAAWWQASGTGWELALGDGWAVCGGGLVTAGPGRGRLSAEDPLDLPRPRWRRSAALVASAPRLAGALTVSRGGWRLALGGGRRPHTASGIADAFAAPAATGHLQLAWEGAGHAVAATSTTRPDGEGRALDLGLRHGPWRLTTAVGRWRRRTGEQGHGWVVHAARRAERWQLGLQLAATGGADGLEAARRSACLSGWRGRGWAARLRWRLPSGLDLAAILGTSRDRDSDLARGRRRQRTTGELRLAGRVDDRLDWALRLRRIEESWLAWDPRQPWLPAGDDGRRERIWLAASVAAPVGPGSGSASWRRLEQAGAARHLLALRWERDGPAVRFRVTLRSAWGDPLDLVAVSAPVAGLVRLRHWGAWEQGLGLGLSGRGRWRWRLGAEWRRAARHAGQTGGGPALEALAGWGLRF